MIMGGPVREFYPRRFFIFSKLYTTKNKPPGPLVFKKGIIVPFVQITCCNLIKQRKQAIINNNTEG